MPDLPTSTGVGKPATSGNYKLATWCVTNDCGECDVCCLRQDGEVYRRALERIASAGQMFKPAAECVRIAREALHFGVA